MPHFFVEPDQIEKDRLYLTGNDVNHIKNALRMGAGDVLTAADRRDGCLYHCRITSVENDKIWAAIERAEQGSSELTSKIYLFQGLPKSDKMDWIVQKAVELGAYEIIPTVTARTVVKLDAKKEKARLARWNAISEGAAKQSGRMIVPRVAEIMDFSGALQYASGIEIKLIPYELAQDMEHTRACLQSIRPGQSVAVFIGPEGGLEEAEVQSAQAAGFTSITLGRRILRTETAGAAVLAMLGLLLER